MSKTMKNLRLPFVGVLCTTLFFAAKAVAVSLAEYPLLLALIAIALSEVPQQPDLPQGSRLLINQLQTAAEGARAAHVVGNRVVEISRLSKAIGAAEALTGMTSACDDCGDLRSTLQQIIGQAALLKTAVVGASGSCQPNGIIGPTEQCDPLAVPIGCPTNATLPFYCSDECTCQVAPIP